MKKVLLSILIPLIILIISLSLNNMIFGGTILVSDLSSQYYLFLLKFMDFFNDEGTLLYTFDFGLGGSMFSIFTYYLLTISNLFLAFISYEKLYIFILVTIIIKVSLCGLTMYKYLDYNFVQKKYLLFFSTAYALSTYILTNYFQIMWLDSYILAPLILLGIDKLIKEKKYLLYCISLIFAIFSNYYMGFIICLFCVLYYLYKVLINKENFINIFKFLFVSFLCGMTTMLTNFTTLNEIFKLGRINNLEIGFNTDFGKIISSLFIGNEMETIVNFTYPRLYIGILMLLFLFLYFINKRIEKREKVISMLFFLLFLSFMIFKPLNNMWHAFSSPIGFNFRYAFLINIFVLYICYKSIEKIDFINKIYYLLFIYLFFIFCFISFVTKTNSIFLIILSLSFAIIYALLYFFSKSKYVFLFFILEICLNTYLVYNDFDCLKSADDLINNDILTMVNEIKEDEESLFYRMDFINLGIRTNDNILYDYYSASSWLSTIRYSNLEFLKNLSYDVGVNSYHFKNNDIINSLFGIKYYADKKSNDKIIFNYNDYNIYKNENALSLGYIVDEKVKEELKCLSSYECQEKILNYMTGNDTNIYKELEANKISNFEYEFLFDSSDDLYVYMEFKYKDDLDLDIYINGQFIRKVDNYNYDIDNVIKLNGILDEQYKDNGMIKIKLVDNNQTTYDQFVKIYQYNYDAFLNEIELLKNKQLEITYFSDEYITGKIEGDGILFTSIPYDDNWDVYIDGKKIKTYKIFNMFLGFDIEKGMHNIEFKYKITNFKYGIIISGLSLLILIYILLREQKNN